MTYPNANKSTYINVHDAPFGLVIVPLTILSILAIFFGYLSRDLFVGMGSDSFAHNLFTHPSHISLIEAEFGLPEFKPLGFEIGVKMLPAILTFAGAGIAVYLYHIQYLSIIELTNTNWGNKIYKFFNGKYYIDVIYNYYFIYNSLNVGYTISKVLDRGFIEFIGPQGLSTSLTKSSSNLAKLDTGNLTDYALYMGIALITLSGGIIYSYLFEYTIYFSIIVITLIFVYIIVKNDEGLNNTDFGFSKNKDVSSLPFMGILICKINCLSM